MSEFENEYGNNDYEYEDILYEAEEPSKTRFCIALCDLHNDKIHGSGPLGHYLVNCRYKTLDMEYISETADFINEKYQRLNNYHHKLLSNYKEIVLSDNYIKPEIVECTYLKSGHCIAIIKTFWIKIIQRKWKNILKKKKHALRHRKNIL
jgi:hypothetical protein